MQNNRNTQNNENLISQYMRMVDTYQHNMSRILNQLFRLVENNTRQTVTHTAAESSPILNNNLGGDRDNIRVQTNGGSFPLNNENRNNVSRTGNGLRPRNGLSTNFNRTRRNAIYNNRTSYDRFPYYYNNLNILNPSETTNNTLDGLGLLADLFQPFTQTNFMNSSNISSSIPTRQQIINATTQHIYRDVSSTVQDVDPIDLAPFNPNDAVTRINGCGHLFRTDNLNRWFTRNSSCPVCRYNIRTNRPIITPVTNNTVDISNNGYSIRYGVTNIPANNIQIDASNNAINETIIEDVNNPTEEHNEERENTSVNNDDVDTSNNAIDDIIQNYENELDEELDNALGLNENQDSKEEEYESNSSVNNNSNDDNNQSIEESIIQNITQTLQNTLTDASLNADLNIQYLFFNPNNQN